MIEVTGSAEFFAAMRNLIDAWCIRRCLKALSRVLPAYTAYDGLSDGWNALYDALRNVRAFAQDELTAAELETVSVLIGMAHNAILSDRFLDARYLMIANLWPTKDAPPTAGR